MTHLAGPLYGASLFVIINALLAYGAYLGGSRILPAADLATRLVASCLLFLAAILLIAQGLSPFGFYLREAVAVVVVGLAIVAHRAWRHASRLGADIDAVLTSATAVARSRGAVLLVLGVVAMTVTVWRGLERTPTGWDSLTYHLPFAATYVQTRSLGTLTGPMAMDHYIAFPKNGEIVTSWLMLPFHGDLVVGLLNVGLLVFCWLATYAISRRLDLTVADASLAATTLCSSPFLYAYATTQNVDTLVCAGLAAALLFLTRYLVTGAGVDALLVCAAAGVAAGTKYTALPLVGMMVGTLGVVACISSVRSGFTARRAAWLCLAICTVAALGARQYVLNTWRTGNPIYPISIKVGQSELLPGSPYTDRLVEDLGTGERADDLAQIALMFHYFPGWSAPTTAGPKYAVLLGLALLAAMAVTGRRRWLIRLLMFYTVVGVMAVELPGSGFTAQSRRFWQSDVARLMAVNWMVCVVVAMTMLPRANSWRENLLRGLLVAFTIWDIVLVDSSFQAGLTEIAIVAALACVVALPGLALPRRPRRSVVVATAAVMAVVGLVALDRKQSADRWPSDDPFWEVDGTPKDFLAGWRQSDQAPPQTIAFATGFNNHGQNWFIYPLMGRRLQNTVVYVPLNLSDPPGSRAFIRRENPVHAEWLRQLQQRKVNAVYVQAPWPIEDGWMREDQRRFTLVLDTSSFRVYYTHEAGS